MDLDRESCYRAVAVNRALRLLSEEGLAAATLETLAARLGIGSLKAGAASAVAGWPYIFILPIPAWPPWFPWSSWCAEPVSDLR